METGAMQQRGEMSSVLPADSQRHRPDQRLHQASAAESSWKRNMEDGEDIQQAERVGLQRKLTGPPRLLLGKTRTRSLGEDRAEKTDHSKASANDAPAAAAESKAGPTAETESRPEASCRGRCAGHDIRPRKRYRWWSRLSSAVICIRKERKTDKESLGQKNSSVPPQGALQEAHAAPLNTTEEESEMASDKRKTRSVTVSHAEKRSRRDEASTSFQRRLQKFFSRGRQTPPSVPPGETEDTRTAGAVPSEVDEQSAMTDGRQRCPDRSLAEVVAEDLKVGEAATRAVQEATEVAPETKLAASEGDRVLPTDAILDFHDQPSASTRQTATTSLHLMTNGPSIRIELIPPDEEEEECWEDGSALENHLLLLFHFDHRERRLLQTARSLVRAAVNAAVDELTREQQSVHRQPQGYRDHA